MIFWHKPVNILYISDEKDGTDGSNKSNNGKDTDGKNPSGKGTEGKDLDGTDGENKPRTTINPKFGM